MQENKVIYTTPIEECKFREPYKVERSVIAEGLKEKKIWGYCIVEVLFCVLVLFFLIGTFVWVMLNQGFTSRSVFMGIVTLIYGIGSIIEVKASAGWISAYRSVCKGDYQISCGKVDGKNDKPHRYRREAYFYLTMEDGTHARAIGDTRWDKLSVGSNVSIVMTKNKNVLILVRDK